MKNLQDRVAVITGAGSGIGRATALALAEAGCDLALSDVSQAGLDETVALLAESGRKVSAHIVNVADRERMAAHVDEVLQAHGRVHILINNAGVASGARFLEQSLEDFERVLDINLRGVIYGSKFFLPHIKEAGEGHVVNISSILGLMPAPMVSAYCTSKFAVRGFSQCLWLELREHNIGVTCVHPGNIKTSISDSAVVTADEADRGLHAEFSRQMTQKGANPGVVAKAIVKGIRKDRQRALVTVETNVMERFMRMFPTGAIRVIAWGAERARKSM